MLRAQFLLALAGLAASPVLPGRAPCGGTALRARVERLEAVDERHGSAGLVGTSRELAAALCGRADADPAFGRLAGAAAENAAWTAFDAGLPALALRRWDVALVLAVRHHDRATAARARASMALAAADTGDGVAAVRQARAARRVRPDAPAHLASLLSARAALGHGHRRDGEGTRVALGAAESALGAARGDAEESWLRFWGPADLACHRAKALAALGDRPGAERAAREAVAGVPAAQRRNATLYQGLLAGLVAARGELDEARGLVDGVVAGGLPDSARVRARLTRAVSAIGARDPGYHPAWARATRELLVVRFA
ncbi:hypothetical protein [Cryptosporangium arvum]|uniref:hypothetical protein n=1 Tax=Cryptosporangium arvum TaxID=80871 RepID=UPI0004B4B197|nr:hypothetical protein [Cryptosporangium arvum]